MSQTLYSDMFSPAGPLTHQSRPQSSSSFHHRERVMAAGQHNVPGSHLSAGRVTKTPSHSPRSTATRSTGRRRNTASARSRPGLPDYYLQRLTSASNSPESALCQQAAPVYYQHYANMHESQQQQQRPLSWHPGTFQPIQDQLTFLNLPFNDNYPGQHRIADDSPPQYHNDIFGPLSSTTYPGRSEPCSLNNVSYERYLAMMGGDTDEFAHIDMGDHSGAYLFDPPLAGWDARLGLKLDLDGLPPTALASSSTTAVSGMVNSSPISPATQEDGDVLVGMGLYEKPSQASSSLLSSTLFGNSKEQCLSSQSSPMGKGLKLEEEWRPPTPPPVIEDDGDVDELDGEGELDQVAEEQLQATAIRDSVAIAATTLSPDYSVASVHNFPYGVPVSSKVDACNNPYPLVYVGAEIHDGSIAQSNYFNGHYSTASWGLDGAYDYY